MKFGMQKKGNYGEKISLSTNFREIVTEVVDPGLKLN